MKCLEHDELILMPSTQRLVEMKALTAMRAGGEPSVSRQVPIALMDVDSWAGRRVWASFDGDIMADGCHVYLSLVMETINSP